MLAERPYRELDRKRSRSQGWPRPEVFAIHPEGAAEPTCQGLAAEYQNQEAAAEQPHQGLGAGYQNQEAAAEAEAAPLDSARSGQGPRVRAPQHPTAWEGSQRAGGPKIEDRLGVCCFQSWWLMTSRSAIVLDIAEPVVIGGIRHVERYSDKIFTCIIGICASFSTFRTKLVQVRLQPADVLSFATASQVERPATSTCPGGGMADALA